MTEDLKKAAPEAEPSKNVVKNQKKSPQAEACLRWPKKGRADESEYRMAKVAEGEAEKLSRLEKTIGYTFADKMLLFQALCHSSYANEHRDSGACDNERLEFLGDSVLEVCSSDFLYRKYPQLPEGELTKFRASIVCEPTLALCARAFGLPQYLYLGKGEERTGGRRRNSIVSDALEAVIGAVFLDGGILPADRFIDTFIMNDAEHKKLFVDSKTILQEVVQRNPSWELTYELTGEEGPDHDKHFSVAVKISGKKYGEGSGSNKKAAEQEAAYHTLIELKKQGIQIYVSEKP